EDEQQTLGLLLLGRRVQQAIKVVEHHGCARWRGAVPACCHSAGQSGRAGIDLSHVTGGLSPVGWQPVDAMRAHRVAG
ncbi:MAG: hypothetical protein ACN6RG_15895, partial [Stenotrophomonas sp.]